MKTFKTPKGTELQILDMRGKDYLEVKYRLVWFREDHPTWGIETSFIELTAQYALAKSIIKDESGRIIATAHKSETPAGFPDYIEKAETGSIGRALALIGYGTQFCADELEEGSRIVDAPVQPKTYTPTGVRMGSNVAPEQPGPEDGYQPPPNENQFGAPKVGFGQWKAYTYEELPKKVSADKIAGYVDFLQGKGQPLAKPMGEAQRLFVTKMMALPAVRFEYAKIVNARSGVVNNGIEDEATNAFLNYKTEGDMP